jgi:hypothetical protein
MSPVKHIAASGVTSLVFYFLTRSWIASLVCFLSGIFIDIDHLFDYYRDKKKMCWSLRTLDHYCFHEREGKIYLVFHSYELLAVLWIVLAVLLHFQPLAFGLIFGMTVHVLFDQFTNPTYPLAYFWFCRRKFGFPKKIFFKEDFAREFLR